MNDKDLEKIALKYGIGAGSPTGGYLREYAIEKLIQRDTTLRTRFNVALAFLKIFVPSGIGLTILYALYRFVADALRGMF